jgi:hypothetical protein
MAVSTTKSSAKRAPAAPAKPAEPDGKPSTTEQMAADATVADVEFPDGCPELRAPHEMSRRERVPYFKALTEVGRLQKDQPASFAAAAAGDDETPTEIRLEDAVAVTEMLVAIEDLLVTTAADEAVFQEWAARVDDAVLVQAFNAFMRRKQPGEAQSSAG